MRMTIPSGPTLKERRFVETVWAYYAGHGRHHLPWRRTNNPYRILVSEVMLQQTQVERVIPKYKAFLKRFPTVVELATASLSEVLLLWQGLGYNRRAKLLHETAKAVVFEYRSQFPKTTEALRALPGIGLYTASAICAFAYNSPAVLIETNVRTVFLHHFFADRTGVTDAEILLLVEKTIPKDAAREWYAALMDYGSYLKRVHGNVSRRSATYTRQSTFKGSNREVRGAIIKLLAQPTPLTLRALIQTLTTFEPSLVKAQLLKLVGEGMVTRREGRYCLPT